MGELPMIESSTNNKKVCHVTSAHPRYDVRIFHKECKSLAYNGFDVTLLVNDNLPNEAVDGVKIVSTQLELNNRYDRMVKSKKKIKTMMLKTNADIYHFHDPELLPEASWIKNKGKKVIFDFHEDASQQILFKTWIPVSLRKIISFIYKSYEQNKAKSFDALITVTPKFVDRLKRINPNTIMVTNYPIVNKENGKSNGVVKKKAICFAGGISNQWNHENIIKAIESIDEVEYILAGGGSQEYIDTLKKLNGWAKVRYLGRIPHEEVVKIYEESMIGMTLLSNNTQVGDEGTLGNTKIFEFMESGLPVICSNNKLWSDIVDRYKCGVSVDPNSVEEIRNSIVLLTSNKDKAFEMGLRGMSAVRSDFNWETMENNLVNLYHKLLIN